MSEQKTVSDEETKLAEEALRLNKLMKAMSGSRLSDGTHAADIPGTPGYIEASRLGFKSTPKTNENPELQDD